MVDTHDLILSTLGLVLFICVKKKCDTYNEIRKSDINIDNVDRKMDLCNFQADLP